VLSNAIDEVITPIITMKYNPDLLFSLLIVFCVLRIKHWLNLSQKLIAGLKFFVPNVNKGQYLAGPPRDPTRAWSPIDGKLKALQLSMIELDGSTIRGLVLKQLPFYQMYDTLLTLGLSVFLIHWWSAFFHCFIPEAPYSFWAKLLTVALALAAVHSEWRIIRETGFEAMECRAALFAGLTTFLMTLILLLEDSIDIMGLNLEVELERTAHHANAMLKQLSEHNSTQSIYEMIFYLKIFLSFIVAIIVVTMTIPAIRFSQTFLTLVFGSKGEVAPPKMRALLFVDYLLPIAVFFLYTPFGIPTLLVRAVTSALYGTSSSSAAWSAGEYDGQLLSIQLVAVILLVVVRLAGLRQHLQCFMDAVVKPISVEIALPSADRTVIQVPDIYSSISKPHSHNNQGIIGKLTLLPPSPNFVSCSVK
jgi:hypothetical protein